MTSSLFPPGVRTALVFITALNALSFQMVLGAPMVLYAKSLAASATGVGIIVGMTPLLTIFQIPAAQFLSRTGYRQFVLAGWSIRVAFLFLIALVPLTWLFLAPSSRLALILMLLFCFNLSRGISTVAWLPWITALVPEPVRGRYLAKDAVAINLGSLAALCFGAVCLGSTAESWRFALLFGASGLVGMASLTFLKRIPEVAAPEQRARSNTPVPWGAMLRFPPFFSLIKLSLIWAVAYGGLAAFTVTFMSVELRLPAMHVMLLTSASFVGGLSSLWFLGSRLDHFGSKPVLVFSFALWIGITATWAIVAGKVAPATIPLLATLQFLMGLFTALVGMANMRLVMAVIPAMGRDHFFALFSVIGSLALGLSPIAWGVVIDALATQTVSMGWLEWNRFTFYFAGALVAFGVALYAATRLQEPKAARLEDLLRHVLVTPHRFVMRLWPRSG
jgi:MFS family permease